ncbi:MAG: c-type cytochrome biogenesis protein CcmI [Filomicrobium sp.]
MILWIAYAALVAAVIAVLVRPMLSDRDDGASTEEADLAVYRDQLAEIEAERDRGQIEEAEAESARRELARRLIRRSDDAQRTRGVAAKRTGTSTSFGMAYATAVSIPLISLAIYLSLGSPSMPGMPQSARLQSYPGGGTINELVAKVEAQLRETPEDGRGWDAIAPVYLRLQRFDDAARAYAQAIRLLGETPRRLRGFAEATVQANNGIVVDRARKAYAQILQLEPKNPEARFWLAMADEQEGQFKEAEKGYKAVLDNAPADAPWRAVVEARLKEIHTKSGGATEAPAVKTAAPASPASTPGPTADDVAAAQSLSKDQRQEFINQMVEGLATKLDANPDDFEGWLRLVRAYAVLGRKDDANRALADARKNIEKDNDKQARLDALADELGLGT